ncbi:hypothetical protein RZS08_27225, partial [Arthrospira platensis SPKY1]|nr:hypothetical protein [Arthrospira platensis SPKY1]
PSHVLREGDHHHLHHAKPRHSGLPQQHSALAQALVARASGRVGPGPVAHPLHSGHQVGQLGTGWVQSDAGPLGGGLDLNLAHTGHTLDGLLDGDGAGCAVHARQAQTDAAHGRARHLLQHALLQQIGVVQAGHLGVGQIRQGGQRRIARGRRQGNGHGR